MAKLPHTSFSAIAITFLVMNLSNLLRQVFWAFLCLIPNPFLIVWLTPKLWIVSPCSLLRCFPIPY